MSISISKNWNCGCDKCGHEWKTLDNTIPTICPKCKSKRWNWKADDDTEPLSPKPIPAKPDAPAPEPIQRPISIPEPGIETSELAYVPLDDYA